MDTEKQTIIDALAAFLRQRSGMDYRNYGDPASYRSEARSITRDLHDARQLMRAVELRDSITADDLKAAFPRAFSGRLSCQVFEPGKEYDNGAGLKSGYPHLTVKLDYCTGQYFPTEYRKAVCAVLASVLWDRKRADMPKANGKLTRTHGPFTTEHDNIDGKTPGDWLRASFAKEYGRGIASRWFS